MASVFFAWYTISLCAALAVYAVWRVRRSWDYQKRIQKALDLVDKFQPSPLQRLSKAKDRGVRILSIDGGGVRGIIPALLLKDLEERISSKSGPLEHLSDHFDLVCGTSTGALIALAHAHKRVRFGDMCALYRTGAVFDTPHGWLTKIPSLLFTFCQYSPAPLEQLLKLMFGEEKMLDQRHEPKIFVVAYEAQTTEPTTVLLTNYCDTEKGSRQVINRCFTWEAARATSAAPLFFPPAVIEGVRLVDGGMSYNNPIELAVEQAEKIWPNRPIDLILSVGTGQPVVQALSKWTLVSTGQMLFNSIAQSEEQIRRVRGKGLSVERLNITGIHCNLDETDENVLQAVESRTRNWIHDNYKSQDSLAEVILGLAPVPSNKSLSLILFRFDAFQDCGYTEDDVSRSMGVQQFANVIEAITVDNRTSQQSNDRFWSTWISALKTKLQSPDLRMARSKKIVLAAKAPISLALFVGLHLKNSAVAFVNFNPVGRKWDCWDFSDVLRTKGPNPAIFDDAQELSLGQTGRVVLFLSLDPSRSFGNDRLEQIQSAVQSRGFQDGVAGVAYLTCKKKTEVDPSMINGLMNELEKFIRFAEECWPKHSGFIVASALPLPLNYLLGTLLNIQTHRSLTFVENVGGVYEIAWTSEKD